jgi:molybdenum-dependent DNA-binding transcriptional regulator ModE
MTPLTARERRLLDEIQRGGSINSAAIVARGSYVMRAVVGLQHRGLIEQAGMRLVATQAGREWRGAGARLPKTP